MNKKETTGLNIHLATCLLFLACVAAGAAVVLGAWALAHWQPGARHDMSGFLLLYFFAVGIASGVAIPRRLWVCPIGVSLGFYTTGLWISGGASGLGFGLPLMQRAAVAFGIASFAGALAGALIVVVARHLTARRHRIA